MKSHKNALDELLQTEGVVLFDGAMGTQLDALGSPMSGEANISHPEQVKRVHLDYLASGARVLITNTLTMNRTYIESHGLSVDVRQVNLIGARLAKDPGDDHYVLGDISSTGTLLEPYGKMTEVEAHSGFLEQAEALLQGGVDGFVIETMYDLKEALIALNACKQASDLPVVTTIAFNTPGSGGRTIMGDSAAECARQLELAGANAVGANCGDLTPLQVADVIAEMRAVTTLPLLAKPNAGRPHVVGGKAQFEMGPEEFTAGIKKCVEAGAHLVGGCCGTTPEHIRSTLNYINSLGREGL